MDQNSFGQTAVKRMTDLRKAPDRKLSAQRLAELMAAEGIPWTREVVAKLESGRRAGLSVDELIALSVVLEVPPLALLVDPAAESIAVTASRSLDSTPALGWLAGEVAWPGPEDRRWRNAAAPVRFARRWHESVRQAMEALASLSEQRGEEYAELADQLFNTTVLQLYQMKAAMSLQGMTVPPLPRALIAEARKRGIKESDLA